MAALFVTPHDYEAVVWIVAAGVCISTTMFALAVGMHESAGRKGAR